MSVQPLSPSRCNICSESPRNNRQSFLSQTTSSGLKRVVSPRVSSPSKPISQSTKRRISSNVRSPKAAAIRSPVKQSTKSSKSRSVRPNQENAPINIVIDSRKKVNPPSRRSVKSPHKTTVLAPKTTAVNSDSIHGQYHRLTMKEKQPVQVLSAACQRVLYRIWQKCRSWIASLSPVADKEVQTDIV